MKNESVVGRLRASASRQKPKVLRVSLAAGLTSALWCGAPRPAQAEWSMRYEWTGTTGAIGQSFPWELPDSEWTRDSQGFMTPYEGADGVKNPTASSGALTATPVARADIESALATQPKFGIGIEPIPNLTIHPRRKQRGILGTFREGHVLW